MFSYGKFVKVYVLLIDGSYLTPKLCHFPLSLDLHLSSPSLAGRTFSLPSSDRCLCMIISPIYVFKFVVEAHFCLFLNSHPWLVAKMVLCNMQEFLFLNFQWQCSSLSNI